MSYCPDCAASESRIRELESQVRELEATALAAEGRLARAAIRLEILADRMRGCHAETGNHELLDEADAFVRETREDARWFASLAVAGPGTGEMTK